MQPGNRRKQWIINPRAQWGYVGRILALEALVAMVTALLTAAVTVLALHGGPGGGLEASAYWHRLLLSLGLLTLLCGAGLIYAGVRLSNRIFGAAYHIRRVFHEAAERNRAPEKIRLRGKDELHDVAETINAWLEQQTKAER